MSRRNFIILLTAVLAVALYPFSASAQKQDILGIKPGMEVSDLVEKMKIMGATCGETTALNTNIIPAAHYDLQCVLPGSENPGEVRKAFFLTLTKHLRPQKVIDVAYSFDSGLRMDVLAKEISDQFGEKPNGPFWMWDLHNGYILTLGERIGSTLRLGTYSLILTNNNLHQLEQDAADAERRSANPPTKF